MSLRNGRFALPALATIVALAHVGVVRADRVVWRVQAGDALSVLAQRFGVSVDELREWNGLEGDRILIGQELVVGSPGADARLASVGPVERPAERAERAAEPRRAEPEPEPITPPPPSEPRRRRAEPSPPPAPPPEARDLPAYVVQRGDTLSHVAHRHATTVEELTRLNPELRSGRLLAGASIRVPVPEGVLRIEHVVRRGETLGRLAERHRVTVRDIVRWNPGIRRHRLLAGRTIVMWSVVPPSVSMSVGAPNRGRLVEAEPLPPNPGYMIRDRGRAFGTLETVLWLQDAVQAVQDRHPRSPRIRVHDISLREGGPMIGHRSHQSGRDVDISLYQRRCPDGVCPMRRMNPEDLDVERTFTLFEHWLKNEQVEAIFLDYALQAPLVAEGRRRGYSRAQLARWFQNPHGPAYPLGTVRHFPLHRDHAHVRFVCPDTDEECR
ncbi:MAG: penicillin-insensitive murein endopeptidase [Myxococcales bacterium]|nr:penicillin-insensitive murein endopeptidase [Myxococcales bacterium]